MYFAFIFKLSLQRLVWTVYLWSSSVGTNHTVSVLPVEPCVARDHPAGPQDLDSDLWETE